jgi:dihydroorotase-like cyclic amidohydrolase
VRADRLRSRSKNSWLIGERLNGRVVLTIASGKVAFE